eukprot:3568103-Rhodomonas_salina.1
MAAATMGLHLFTTLVQDDVITALAIPRARLKVLRVSAGSVILLLSFLPDPSSSPPPSSRNPLQLVAELSRQVCSAVCLRYVPTRCPVLT